VIYALLAPKLDEWVNKCGTHIIEYYSASKRDEILMHSTTWMSLENIMQNKKDTKEQILYDYTYVSHQK
jgi:hypothetical protein